MGSCLHEIATKFDKKNSNPYRSNKMDEFGTLICFEQTLIAKELGLPVRLCVNCLKKELLLKRKRKVETETTAQWRRIAKQEMERA